MCNYHKHFFMEIIDIGVNNLEQISMNLNESDIGFSGGRDGRTSPADNLGPGIELLMNDNRKRSVSNTLETDLGELDNLEKELNELSGSGGGSKNGGGGGGGGFASSMFNFTGFGKNNSASNTNNTNNNIDIGSSSGWNNEHNLGQATKDTAETPKTWDGFTKMNEIPTTNQHTFTNMNDREKRRKKRMMIKKLEEWNEKKIIKNYSNFDMNSSYEEVEDEYETALEDKRKKDSVKLQGWWFMSFVNSIEYANAYFNPFDLNLDGWGEQVSEDIDSYEEIFAELHEKYKGGKLSPELSLLLRLGFSASVVNFTNKALSTATPGFNDVIKQSPELMKLFTNATVDSMKQSSPGFSMASNIVNNPQQLNTSFGPPPPPIETKNQPPPHMRPGMQQSSNRPDINMARGAMMNEKGVNLQSNFSDYSNRQPPQQPPPPPPKQTSQRMEMRGPQNVDLENIFAGLKPSVQENKVNAVVNNEDDSMISISSLKDLQNNNPPKKSRGRRKSDKVISLDI